MKNNPAKEAKITITVEREGEPTITLTFPRTKHFDIATNSIDAHPVWDTIDALFLRSMPTDELHIRMRLLALPNPSNALMLITEDYLEHTNRQNTSIVYAQQYKQYSTPDGFRQEWEGRWTND